MRTCALLAAVLWGGLVGGCSRAAPALPDRSDPTVRTEEARLASVIGAATTDATVLGENGSCAVRLLGTEGEAAFVWATCTGGTSPRTGVSAPMRVVGSRVDVPGDGEDYERDIRRMFPEDLADAVVTGDASLRP